MSTKGLSVTKSLYSLCGVAKIRMSACCNTCSSGTSSLSYKLKRVLKFRAMKVLTTDPMVPTSIDKDLIPLEQVLKQADILILATPHNEYKSLLTDKPLVDMWGITPRDLA